MTVHEFVRGAGKRSTYNIGWTLHEIELMVKLIDDDEELDDDEEFELIGIRKKLMRKRKNLRQRTGDTRSVQF
jgi:hypothetical protein